MKRKYLILALSLLCILGVVGGSYAVYSKSIQTESVITSSSLEVELVVLEEVDGESKVVSGSVKVTPGASLSRLASVKNIGNEPAWIRMMIEKDGEPMVDDPTMMLEGLDSSWIYQDGYWYYSEIVEPGESTTNLFSGITFSESLGNEDAGKEISLEIKAQGVQSEHNGNDVLSALGWPSN